MKKKWFTLIELLVVVTILALLAWWVVYTWVVWKNKARNTVVENDLRAIQNAMETYYMQNKSYPLTHY